MGTVARVATQPSPPPPTLVVLLGIAEGMAEMCGVCCSDVGPSWGTGAGGPHMLAAYAPALLRWEVCRSNSAVSRDVSMSPTASGLKPGGRVVVDVKVGPLAFLRCVKREPATGLKAGTGPCSTAAPCCGKQVRGLTQRARSGSAWCWCSSGSAPWYRILYAAAHLARTRHPPRSVALQVCAGGRRPTRVYAAWSRSHRCPFAPNGSTARRGRTSIVL